MPSGASNFPKNDLNRIPEHWQRFGARVSPLTGSPRLAANPPNAILNYLYSVLESEARLAAAALGLDPGLGVLHLDTPGRVAVGRFDAKNLDAVVNDGTSFNALVLLGDGTGHFANSTFIDLGGAFTYGFAIADFNRDHKEDLAVTTETGSGNVYIFLGNGDGTFQSAQVFPTGGQDPGPVLVGDFNRDGIEDLAVLNVGVPDSAGSVAVLLGNGDGTFQVPKLFPLPARFYTTSAIRGGRFQWRQAA